MLDKRLFLVFILVHDDELYVDLGLPKPTPLSLIKNQLQRLQEDLQLSVDADLGVGLGREPVNAHVQGVEAGIEELVEHSWLEAL